MADRPELVKLNTGHLAAVKVLLTDCGLPVEDCHEHINQFVGIFEDKDLVALGGVERLDEYGLLRSVAVHELFRGQEYARHILDYLHQKARDEGMIALYLLTETATNYFSNYGYRNVDRDTLPIAIKNTQQFQSLCPDSAQAMEFLLHQDNC